jgi:hypothetical protein
VRVTRLNDQHTFLQVPEELRVGLGEVWSFGISHPAAFDRWPAILLVEQRHRCNRTFDLAESIAELRDLAADRDDLLAEAAGIGRLLGTPGRPPTRVMSWWSPGC